MDLLTVGLARSNEAAQLEGDMGGLFGADPLHLSEGMHYSL
jgi:hypothetical protein